jgi:hypothetical protein
MHIHRARGKKKTISNVALSMLNAEKDNYHQNKQETEPQIFYTFPEALRKVSSFCLFGAHKHLGIAAYRNIHLNIKLLTLCVTDFLKSDIHLKYKCLGHHNLSACVDKPDTFLNYRSIFQLIALN